MDQPTNAIPADPARAEESPGRPEEGDRLKTILPQIKDLARQVGGFGNLADIARELDRSGE